MDPDIPVQGGSGVLDLEPCALRLQECWGFRGLMGRSKELSGIEEGASTRGILLSQIYFG